MPAPVTFLQGWLLLFSSFLHPGSSVPLKRADPCPGYRASNVQRSDSRFTADLTLAGTECNIYSQDLHSLTFLAEWQTDSRLHIIISDKDEQVYQVPDFVVPRPSGSVSSNAALLDVSIEEEPFTFTVTRKSNGEEIFSTKGSNLVFETQYWRLRTSLPNNPSLYGLGEHTDSLRLPTSNYVRTMWARDAGAVPQNSNLYGTHPVYYEQRAGSGNSHGVLLLNSNGMDIKINNDNGQYLEYNVVGGVIDLYFLAGPGPLDVAREYSEITQKAAMMPYWGLGFHQCRFGYKSVEEVAAVVANYRKAKIPLETMWTDIDYMDKYKVFTLGEKFPLDGMRSLVKDLHGNDQHYIVMVDPAVAAQDYDAYNNGVSKNVFLKKADGSVYKGRVWPGVTAFPDWFHENTQGYWDSEFATFFDADTGVDIDALWIDMNEPSNFCNFPCDNPEVQTNSETLIASRFFAPRAATPEVVTPQVEVRVLAPRQEGGKKKGLPGRNLLDPSYKIKNAYGILSNKTANTDLIHQGGWAEYDTHNLYGTMMSSANRKTMLKRRPDKRPMVITRSTFVGAGSYVGHWLGDNVSAWDQYLASIRHLLQFVSFFQVPMVGADVCGFLESTNEHLCARWTVLGAFYPFYRNHNVDGATPQEAYRWESVAAAARKAIDIRYRLLDYIYTAMHKQTVDGTPMLAPLWMYYPSDANTLAIETQFLYGSSLLINPVVQESSTSVSFYLPNDVWYDFATLKPVPGSGTTITYSGVSDTDIPILVRGGSIIPLRVKSAMTTKALRDQDFELLVAPDKNGNAQGTLYLDDGESLVQSGTSEISFSWNGNTIKMGGSFGFGTRVGVKSVTVLDNEGAQKYDLNEGLDGPWEHKVADLKKS
ncbi:glycoside hydrolase family 31 protein [Cucurbitaria berberidis CBS 394.84]|uniref:Glycoside hydrolase family 31 protein n=1 Tax=Cucurbitaria berberidis CBS 394.84 TaxID=1168544 RepID=A0A9P4LBF1_9PLEO|nr:glycoside hydrolase family 31 protein [Cucurbitaria berberidis CBS 394.84]KAF1849516.1 glycoside hydrolase family 31 protein [Cucurbitaria berberidis CBS 394.84]